MRPLLALALLGCGPGPQPVAPAPGPGSTEVAPKPEPVTPPSEPTQEERLAAIQKAMNELDEAAQGCWAAAATERFDIEGEVTLTIDIAPKRAQVTVARDTARNVKLATCLRELLAGYPWAPPLHGETIQLPFKFRAPDGQNVIDRALVAWAGQGKLAVATLVDENNTGNAAASLFELAIEAGASTGYRSPERAELWSFLGPATVEEPGTSAPRSVATGDMMFVPKGAVRKVTASQGAVHAMIAMVPGGREGSARAGALPTREVSQWKEPPPGPLHLPARGARSFARAGGTVSIFAEPATIKSKALSASVLDLPAGAAIPEHVHGETEVLYLVAGSGTITVKGVAMAITASSVVQIPPNTKHAFTAATPVRAVQIYTPAGPEQRFKKP
ncbi:MAG: cupin domain-containing protein [Kofleriaceae bacterium]